MQKNGKKEIRQIVEDTLLLALVKLKINDPSKKIKRGLTKISKELSRVLKQELKQEKKQAKPRKVKTVKKIAKVPIPKGRRVKKSK